MRPGRAWASQRGVSVVEVLIGALLTAIVAAAAFKFYQAHHQLYLAQTDIADRQGNLRFAADVIAKDIRNAGYMVPGSETLRVSNAFDTLMVFIGDSISLKVDTIRYYVNRYENPSALIVQRNGATPSPLALGIDSVRFVPSGGTPPTSISVILISTPQDQFENSALATRRRVGETVNLRNG